jgi:hypothetical protein
MLAAMRAAKRWPWEQVMVELYRDTVWPYLYTRLADQEEADRWRGDIDAEIARLDAAASSSVPISWRRRTALGRVRPGKRRPDAAGSLPR